MKTIAPIIAAATALAFASCTALAACPTTTGSVKPEVQQGIAKNGTRAPLKNGASAEVQKRAVSTGTTTSNGTSQTAQKDGQTMPLANKEGGGDKNLATS
jgi:hypothetical protein